MAEVPSLRDLMLYTVYTRDNCPDLVGRFFVPTLSRAVSYHRATYSLQPGSTDRRCGGLGRAYQQRRSDATHMPSPTAKGRGAGNC